MLRTVLDAYGRRSGWWVVVVLLLARLGVPQRRRQLLEAAKAVIGRPSRGASPRGAGTAAEADGTTALHWAGYRDDIEMARR